MQVRRGGPHSRTATVRHDSGRAHPASRARPAVRGKGVGELLLADAIERVLAAGRSMALWAILVDAKNQAAGKVLQGLWVRAVLIASFRLFLPTATARKAAVAAR